MSHDPLAILKDYLDATNAQDFDRLEQMFAPDMVYVSGGVGGRIDGRAAVIAAFKAYFAEFPDQQASDDRLEAISDRQARVYWRLKANSTKTGKVSERTGTDTITLDEDGLIAHVDVEG